MTARRVSRWATAGVIIAALATTSHAGAAPKNVAKVVHTVPPVPGAHFVVRSGVYTADAAGGVTILARPGIPLANQARVPTVRVGEGVRAKLAKWHGRNAGFDVFRRVSLRFTNQDGRPVAASTITGVTLRASTGTVYRLDSVKEFSRVWLQSSRAVVFGDRLESKPIYYTVSSVVVRGANVVNSGQQKFFPNRRQAVAVRLLFFSARLRAQDALFRFPLGSGVFLQYPDGGWERASFSNGEAIFPSLPRGDYQVRVDGPGYSFTRPMALSRDQDLNLEVLSFLDIALVLTLLVVFAVGLLLVGRPHLVAAYVAPSGRWLRDRLRPGHPRHPEPFEDVTVFVRNKKISAQRLGGSVVVPYRRKWLVAAADETAGGVIVISVPRATSFETMDEAMSALRTNSGDDSVASASHARRLYRTALSRLSVSKGPNQ